MKLSALFLLAGLFSFSAASAQTTPDRGTTTASPSAVPSGSAPMPNNPKGMVSAGEAFTTGSSKGSVKKDRSMKMKKDKSMMHDGKMKEKM